MKRCPECRRDYYDDTLLYCLDDGNALLEGPASVDEPATAILSESAAAVTGFRDGEAPTRPQIHRTAEAEPRAAKPQNKRNRSFVILGITALLLVGGFFGYRYFVTAKQIESIAVMPFVNESGNADVEYLSDGMTETLINSLSQVPNLNVKARSSVFRYKGKELDPKKIASELNVQAILTGRVVQRGAVDALPGRAHSVQVEVVGLEPARWYFYRFIAGDEISPVGRTRTAPAASEQTTQNVETVAAASEELSSSIQEINNQVSESTRIVASAVAEADQANAKVAGLSEAAKKIPAHLLERSRQAKERAKAKAAEG